MRTRKGFSPRVQRIIAAPIVGLWMLVLSPLDVAAAVDVTAPDTPTGVFVDGGSAWRSVNRFDVWWHNPAGQETPIAIAHYELCPAIPLGPCTEQQAAGQNISELDLVLPYAGWFWLRVWLEDAAGNVNANAKSSQVMLRFDDAAPPEAHLRHDDVWLGAGTPASPGFVVEIDVAAEWPMSGIQGYSIALNDDLPDEIIDVTADQDYERFQAAYEFHDVPEGTTTVRVRSISNSGVASEVTGVTRIRLDRSPPVVDGTDLPSGARWHRHPLEVSLQAHDQAHLSGMVAAPAGSPIDEGAHIAYELDGGSVERFRGAQGLVPVVRDGIHTLTYRAFDAAGNASVQKEAVFRIDGTGPVGAFRALDPGDPRALRVDVEDATSGVADGRIEYRREGEKGFTRLATASGSGVLTARMDDETLPVGRYELRAVVTDVAGNEAVIDKWADGTAMSLTMPLRVGATLEAVGEVKGKAKRCGKATKKSRGKGRRKPASRRKCRTTPTATRTLKLGYGKRSTSSGRLTTSQGVPIGGAAIVVEGQLRFGGAFTRIGMAETDAQGRFRFKIPAGPSRTVRYRYDGTNTVQAASAAITTKVRAAARLKVDRRRLRNGQTVRFTGRLLGKPIPTQGKLVALQAKVGRGWRTFATPRANAKGAFKHRYRFTATTGLRRYAFRAVVAREGAYSYEAGLSPIVRVTVRGGR